MTITFDEKTQVKMLRLDDGHIHIWVPIVCEGSADDDSVLFVYDTGAFITVLNYDRYKHFKLYNIPRHEITLHGYAGETSGYLYKIPGLKIGKRLVKGVWAFTPKSPKLKQNLLGSNVLEYFRPFQDNMHDFIYFPDNFDPKPFHSKKHNISLACEGVLILEEDSE